MSVNDALGLVTHIFRGAVISTQAACDGPHVGTPGGTYGAPSGTEPPTPDTLACGQYRSIEMMSRPRGTCAALNIIMTFQEHDLHQFWSTLRYLCCEGTFMVQLKHHPAKRVHEGAIVEHTRRVDPRPATNTIRQNMRDVTESERY